MFEVASYKCCLNDPNNKGGLGKLYRMHGKDKKYIQWYSKKPVGERHDNETWSSIQSGELHEYMNDIAYDGLPSLELFINVLIYLTYLFIYLFM